MMVYVRNIWRCVSCGLEVKKIPKFEKDECPGELQHNFQLRKKKVEVDKEV